MKNSIRKMNEPSGVVGEKILSQKIDVKNSSWKINCKNWSSR